MTSTYEAKRIIRDAAMRKALLEILQEDIKMTKQLYELEFDEAKLGPMWMNVDNLKLLLYGDRNRKPYSTKPELLSVKEVTRSAWKWWAGRIAIGFALVLLISAALFCTIMTAISMWDLSQMAESIWN